MKTSGKFKPQYIYIFKHLKNGNLSFSVWFLFSVHELLTIYDNNLNVKTYAQAAL